MFENVIKDTTQSGGGSGGSVGALAIYTKATNSQAAVFSSTANRDSYFASNPDELDAISGRPYMVGVGTTPEDPTSVVGLTGWYAYDALGFPSGWQPLATILRGEKGEKGDAGSTPTVLTDQINHASHGFTQADADAGLALKPASGGGFERASNDSVANTATAMLASVVDANNYVVVLAGYGNSPSHGFSGDVYYLGTNGAVTSSKPNSDFAQELFRVIDADTLSVNIAMPQEVVTSSGGGGSTFENLIDEVADRHGITTGNAFTNEAAVELFSSALGTPVTVRTTNGRVNGTYAQGSPSAIWCNGGNPPTGNGAFLEVIIPANVISNMDLVLSGNRASSTGTRGYWVYDGNPTSGGTSISPVQGSWYNGTTDIRPTTYDLGSINGDIHLVFSKILLSDLQLIPSSIRANSLVTSGKFSEGFAKLYEQASIGHGENLSENQVNQCLQGLGIGATIRTDAGRAMPKSFNSGVGRGFFAHVENQDETTNNAQVVELIIPRRNLTHATAFDLGFLQVSTGGTDRTVSVYYGDPSTGASKATPVRGTESHGAYERVIYNASDTPDALGDLPHDIHIVVKRACLITFDIFTNDATTAKTNNVEELRGGARPAEFSDSQDYAIGDTVYRSSENRVYQAVQTVTAGAWNPSDWKEDSLLEHGSEIAAINIKNAAQDNDIQAVRGNGAYPAFDSTANYNKGDKVYFNSKNWEAKNDITAGAFDQADWFELSVVANALPTQIRDRLETLTGSDRLPLSAINHADYDHVIYVNSAQGDDAANSGKNPFEPKATLTAALNAAYLLPSSSKRIVYCEDACNLSEDITIVQNVDIYMPNATIVGNLQATALGRVHVEVAAISGNVTVNAFDHFRFQQVSGNLIIGNCSAGAAYIHCEDWLTGNVNSTNAAGTLSLNIIHNDAGLTIPVKVGFTPKGHIAGVPINPEDYARSLETLAGSARLDASAIKNLPSGGSDTHSYADFTGMGAAGDGWYDLATWGAVTELDSSGCDFVLFMKATNTDVILTYRINMNTPRGLANAEMDTTLRILGSLETASLDGADFRLIREDASDLNSGIRLQIKLSVGNTYDGFMSSYIPLPHDSTGTFGSAAKYTETGSEKQIQLIKTLNWRARNITSGTTGGIACESVGEHSDASRAWIDFSTGNVLIHSEDQVVQNISSSGTRFSAGEFGSWEQASNDHPFVSSSFPQVTAAGRTNLDDATLNPFGDAVLDGTPYGMAYNSFAQPSGPNLRRLTWNSLNASSNLQIDIAGDGVAVGSTIGMKATFQGIFNAPDADETFEVRIGSVSGNVIATWNIAQNFIGEIDFEFKHAVTAQEASAKRARFYIVQTAGSATATNRSGLARYAVTVDSVEPALQTNVVGQFDSNYRGVLLPRIALTSSSQHSKGALALNALDDNNLVIHNGTDWSKFDKHTNVVTSNEHSYIYSAELSLSGLQTGWTIQNAQEGIDYRVEPIDGFPAMAHFLGTTAWAYFAPDVQNVDQFWTDARSNGLVCKTRFKYVAGEVNGAIEINAGTDQGFGGTYRTFFSHVDANTFRLEWVTSSTDLAVRDGVNLNKNEMYDLQILIPPAEDVYHVIVNGVRVGSGVQCNAYTSRIIRTFIGGHADRNIQIQSHGFYVMGNDAASRQITQQEIDNDARIIVPETSKTSEILLPKGLQAFDKTVEIENGSAQVVELKASSGDTQLIGGETVHRISPFSSIRIRQTDLPWGNQWAASDSKLKTSESQGKQVSFNVSGGSLTAHAKHGTYSGDINITRATGAAAGAYVIAPSGLQGHVFSTQNTYISAQLIGAPVDYEIKVEFATGLPEVRCYDAANNLIDHDFSITLAW